MTKEEEATHTSGHSLPATSSNDSHPNPVDAPALDPKVQDELGRVFRTFCDDLIHQPIPDKLVVLLARLEAKQRDKR